MADPTTSGDSAGCATARNSHITEAAASNKRPILSLPRKPAEPDAAVAKEEAPVSEYARAFILRMARLRAGRAAERRAKRRAKLAAKAFELVSADRLGGSR